MEITTKTEAFKNANRGIMKKTINIKAKSNDELIPYAFIQQTFNELKAQLGPNIKNLVVRGQNRCMTMTLKSLLDANMGNYGDYLKGLSTADNAYMDGFYKVEFYYKAME